MKNAGTVFYKIFLEIIIAISAVIILASCSGTEKTISNTPSPETVTEQKVITVPNGATVEGNVITVPNGSIIEDDKIIITNDNTTDTDDVIIPNDNKADTDSVALPGDLSVTGDNAFSSNDSTMENEDNAPTPSDTASEAFSSPEMEAEYAAYAEDYEAFYGGIAAQKDFPVVAVTTLYEKPIESKEEYVTSVVDVFDTADAHVLSAEAGVKLRGNSFSRELGEFPFRIKFTKKQNMLGLHNGEKYKSWVLLSSHYNLVMDYMAFRLGRAILDEKYYVTDATFVNLYINGKYQGIYLLCEQNQAAKGRIDVNQKWTDPDETKIGYAMELDNYPSEEHPYFGISHDSKGEITDILGESRVARYKHYSLKNDEVSEPQLRFIEKYMRGVYDILWNASVNNEAYSFDDNYNLYINRNITPQQAVEAVIDTESLADMLILEELVQNYDVGEGSFFMAVDFSEKSKYKKLTFLAPWDFSWAYYENPDKNYYACTFQNPNIGDRSNIWLITAMKCDWFEEIVKTRWKELDANNIITKTTAQVIKDVEPLYNDLGEEFWKIDLAKNVADFVNRRVKYLNKNWK